MGKGGVIQSKTFPCRHENQNLDLQNPCRSWAGFMAAAYDLKNGR